MTLQDPQLFFYRIRCLKIKVNRERFLEKSCRSLADSRSDLDASERYMKKYFSATFSQQSYGKNTEGKQKLP